ncbi:hypothetical protein CRE_22526 [Caenorhabditis remanei]|uniref:DUF7809 domain-containing protein n=1 Tax=Caenorhabditis remanei TaxID=31234 RepID=E3MU72_CAERE|nr:hypothetical protein CRE_22526 [Caenorhabditis remanei]
MSKYLKSPDNMLTSTCLHSIAHSYILNDIRSSIDKNIFYEPECFVRGDGEEMIQKMLENSNFKLRMYGSADELAQNLKIYQNFPGSQQFLGTYYEPYLNAPVIYHSLKNEKFICKSDIFVLLQNMAVEISLMPNVDTFRNVVAGTLSGHPEQQAKHLEFVKFDQKVFDEIEMEMRKANSKNEITKTVSQVSSGNFETLVEKHREIDNSDCRTKEDIRNFIKYNLETVMNSSKNPAEAFTVYSVITTMAICLRKIIETRPEMFHQKAPITVRVFEEGDQQFVIGSELSYALWPEKLSEIFENSEKVGTHMYITMRLDEAIDEGGENIEVNHTCKQRRHQRCWEFIRYPIKRAKHRAVPIKGPNPEDPDDWCILAVDAFFEFMKNMITGFSLFPKYASMVRSFDSFKTVFEKLGDTFDPDTKEPYLLQLKSVTELFEMFQVCMTSVPMSVKVVRNAKPDGFTVQNLKNELNHLGLTVLFPEIQDFAENVYEGIDEVKKERYLRTCDLFDAVENCQLICILNRVPNVRYSIYSIANLYKFQLRKFLHNQKGCGRVIGYKCELCEEKKKTSDALEISRQPVEVQKTSDIQNSMKNLKIETSYASVSNQYSQPALSAPKDCEKCSENSVILVKTQNELKISEDQLKEMQQKISNTEKELSEMKIENEKIVESEAKKTEELAEMKKELSKEKEKNQEKEEEILKASKENEELEKANLKLTAENEANERMIQKLLDRITSLSISNQKTDRINEKTIEESTPTTSVTYKNDPPVIDCLICSSQIKSGQEVIRCPLCKRRFHSNVIFSLFSINFLSFSPIFSVHSNGDKERDFFTSNIKTKNFTAIAERFQELNPLFWNDDESRQLIEKNESNPKNFYPAALLLFVSSDFVNACTINSIGADSPPDKSDYNHRRMTSFSKYEKHPLSSRIPISILQIYVIPELRPFISGTADTWYSDGGDGIKEIQKILDNSRFKLRMYGSAEELAENISIFRNFSVNFRFFGENCCLFYTSPVIYHSLKGQKYICKSEMYTILQNMAITFRPESKLQSSASMFCHLLAKYFNSKIDFSKGNVEFVKFDDKLFDGIEREVREGVEKAKKMADSKSRNLNYPLTAESYRAVILELKHLNPLVWPDSDVSMFLDMTSVINMQTKEEQMFLTPRLYLDTFVMSSIGEIIDNRPELFKFSTDSTPITVRLFEDGEERYVMKEELYHALNRLSPGYERFEIHNDGLNFDGMSMNDVETEYGDRILNVEFIRTPILRSKHRAVPIKALSHFVIPAVDFLLEFLREIIFGLKLFQKYQCADWEEFAPIFEQFEAKFIAGRKNPFFIRAGTDISQDLNPLKKYEVLPVKEVRNAKIDGFTVQNLKNELKHLGLAETFSEIEEHAEVVYKHVDSVKKENNLRTCDLFDALENCQLICVLNRIPNVRYSIYSITNFYNFQLKKFLHNQKGCGRVLGYKCEHCEKEKDVQNSMKNLKIKSSSAPIPNQCSQPALSAPKDCEKCSESSAILVETQNELKMSQDQLKETKTKVLDTEKELSDLKREHEEIVKSEAKKTEEQVEMKEELNNEKEKKREKKEVILKASKENEELQKTILKLTAENEANERVIQKLLDRISDLSTNNQKTHQINEKTIEESTPTSSVSSKNAPLVIDCLICSSQIKAGQEVIRCPLCKRRFHSNVILFNFLSSFFIFHIFIHFKLRPFLHDLEFNELPELVDDDGEEMIQRMLDKSNNQLRMYGSAKEIAGNIKIFRSFPESFRFFDDQQYPFNTSPIIYESLNGEKYLCKPDIYTIIQNIALHTIKTLKTTSFHLLLAKVLKSKIAQTDGPVEFVKFDEKMFDEIEKEMREVEKKSHQQASAHLEYLEKFLLTKNYAAIISKFRELNPTVWNDVQANSFLERLQSLSHTEIEKKTEIISTVLINSYIMKCIEQIVQKRAPLFMSTPDTSPITVRLFEDGEERYVMEAELYHALNKVSKGSERFEIPNDGLNFEGMNMNDVKKKYGDQIQNIEFIRTPILRSKHRAVPIRSHFPGQFVIPAVDHFFELWRNAIFGLKLFQKFQCSDWKKFASIFHNIEKVLYVEKKLQKQQYFLRSGYLFKTIVRSSLSKFEVSHINEIKNVEEDGFTVQNLKEELKYLGLTETFSEIQEYAEDVYQGIDKVKKEKNLRTCDLFDAVENCQLICVLNRIPNVRYYIDSIVNLYKFQLKKFLHNQKGCGRVLGYKCAHCEKEKKMPDEVETLEISQQPVEVLKTSEHQNPAKKRKIETSNSSTPYQHSQPALSAPQLCDKCSESSKSLEKAENELKISQDQQKKMVKELSDLKEENKKIVESEAKKIEKLSKEQEEEILKASKKIEELEKANLKLTAENAANERMIEKLLDRISN